MSKLHGRTLDAAVAEKVMDCKVEWSAAIYGDWMDRTSGRLDVHVAHYSSEIAPAMRVVDLLRKTYPVTLWCDADHFVVQIFSGRDGDAQDIANVAGPSLPEAICRAALTVVHPQPGETK